MWKTMQKGAFGFIWTSFFAIKHLQKPLELRPQTGGLSLRDLSTNGVGLRCGRNDTMAKVGTLDADIGYPQHATWSFVLSDASFWEIIVTFFDLVVTVSLMTTFLELPRTFTIFQWHEQKISYWSRYRVFLVRSRRKWTPSFLTKFGHRFFRNLWKLQQRYHVMDTDFWRMQVGNVPGVLVFYIFAWVYMLFSNLFAEDPIGCHADFTFPSSTDAGGVAWHENWELAVKLIKKWCLLFDSVFDLMIKRCIFQSGILTMEMQTCWLWYLIILPHSHQKDLPVYPFWGSKPHWPSALMVWIRLQASLQNLRHSGFHVNMCRNGCCKYMNQILILLLKYDIEKED